VSATFLKEFVKMLRATGATISAISACLSLRHEQA